MNGNEDETYQYLDDAAKAVLKGKCINLNVVEKKRGWNMTKKHHTLKKEQDNEWQKSMNKKNKYNRDNQQNQKIIFKEF